MGYCSSECLNVPSQQQYAQTYTNTHFWQNISCLFIPFIQLCAANWKVLFLFRKHKLQNRQVTLLNNQRFDSEFNYKNHFSLSLYSLLYPIFPAPNLYNFLWYFSFSHVICVHNHQPKLFIPFTLLILTFFPCLLLSLLTSVPHSLHLAQRGAGSHVST